MQTCAQILDCRLWAPGLPETADWARRAASPMPAFGLCDPAATPSAAPGAAEPAALAESVPPMLRRRLTRLGRAAAHVLCALKDPETGANPLFEADAASRTALVFASRWGDFDNAAAQMIDAAAGSPLSPARFATSVHNGAAGVLSIAFGYRGCIHAIAAGPHSLSAAFESAVGLLSEVDRVAVVAVDLKPAAHFNAPGSTYAAAMLLSPQRDSVDPTVQARTDALGPFAAVASRRRGGAPAAWPSPAAPSSDFEVLRWLFSEDVSLVIETPSRSIVWAKDRPYRLQEPRQ